MEYRYTVNRVLRQTADELRPVAHEEAEIEARELVMHSLGIGSRAELAANVNKEINAEQYAELREYILRRRTGEPQLWSMMRTVSTAPAHSCFSSGRVSAKSLRGRIVSAPSWRR